MATHYISNPLVTNGLIFSVDPINSKSYNGSNWLDLSSDASVGTLNNGVSYSSRSFSFDGVDDYISFTNTPGFNITSQITISLWFKSSGTNNNAGLIYKGNFLGSQGLYNIILTNSNINCRFDYNTTSILSVGNITIGRWYNVVLTYDSNMLSMYQDTILVGTQSYSNSIPTQ